MEGQLQGQRGVTAVAAAVLKMGWIFRDQPVLDVGLDGHIEIVEEGVAKGLLIGAQIKSGRSYVNDTNGVSFVLRGTSRHLDYWLHHALPVILVLHDPSDDTCYWGSVTSDTVQTTIKGWKISVPKHQRLDASSAERLKAVASTAKEPYQRRLAQLVVEKPLMDRIASGERLLLYVEEWVHKSSGRGSLTLFTETDEGEEDIVQNWPFVMFPGWEYPNILRHLFPWATLSVDESYYEDNEESDAAMFTRVDLYVPALRPYRVAFSEVAEYRLELELNDIGTAFLALEPYLMEGRLQSAKCPIHQEPFNDDEYCDRCATEGEQTKLI